MAAVLLQHAHAFSREHVRRRCEADLLQQSLDHLRSNGIGDVGKELDLWRGRIAREEPIGGGETLWQDYGDWQSSFFDEFFVLVPIAHRSGPVLVLGRANLQAAFIRKGRGELPRIVGLIQISDGDLDLRRRVALVAEYRGKNREEHYRQQEHQCLRRDRVGRLMNPMRRSVPIIPQLPPGQGNETSWSVLPRMMTSPTPAPAPSIVASTAARSFRDSPQAR